MCLIFWPVAVISHNDAHVRLFVISAKAITKPWLNAPRAIRGVFANVKSQDRGDD